MIARITQTVFLALGLAMVWLGFLYSYELKNMPQQEEEPVVEENRFEVYTLANASFEEEEDVQKVELNKLEEPDLVVSTTEERFIQVPEAVEEDPFAFEEPEVNAAGASAAGTPDHFPYVLAGSGLLLLLCGVASVKISNP